MKSRLSAVTVGSLMSPHPELVDGGITLERLAHDYFLGARHSRYPVLLEGQVVGIVTLPMLKEVAQADWPYVRVVDIADRDLEALVIDETATIEQTVQRLAQDRPGALLVVGQGRLVGIITRADVIALLERDEQLARER